MNPVKYVRLALRSPTGRSRSRSEASRRSSDKRIVSLLSRGNIRLQRGEYATRDDIEEQYERVRSFQFENV